MSEIIIGDNDLTFTQDHKDKISAGLKKYYSNPENRESKSKILKAFYESHPHHRIGSHLTQDQKDFISRTNTGRKPTQEQINKRIATLQSNIKKRISERRSEGHKKYYETHEVWNKGLKWPEDVKERIRQTSIESGVGKFNRGKQYNTKKKDKDLS